MDILSAVSETALITLRSHVIESEKPRPVIEDAVAVICLNRLQSLLPDDVRDRILNRKLPAALTGHIALRARKYDSYCRKFLEKHPDGLVISMGCGFDTRYWRVAGTPGNYMEVDLPEVIEVKKEILGGSPEFEMIGSSVLDTKWMEQVASRQKKQVLFLSEGLFMYLFEKDVVQLFQRLSGTFSESSIVFEMVHKKYTGGFWKKIVESKMKRNSGSKAGSSFNYGIKEAGDIESYAKNLKVQEEWSYFEDPDIKPGFQYIFRNIKMFSRTQWTIKADIG